MTTVTRIKYGEHPKQVESQDQVKKFPWFTEIVEERRFELVYGDGYQYLSHLCERDLRCMKRFWKNEYNKVRHTEAKTLFDLETPNGAPRKVLGVNGSNGKGLVECK